MNSFTKGFLKYFVLPVTTLSATIGITFGTTAHFKNKKIDKAYDRGYNAAIVQQEDYKTELEQYRQLIQEQNSTIQEYVSKVAELDKANKEKQLQIQTLTDTISTKETLISSLQADVQQKESEISSLTTEKTRLETELESAQSSIEHNTEIITGLQAQVKQLNQKIAELEGEVHIYETQIESLKGEKTNLLEQITTLTNDNNKKAEEIITLKGNIQTLQSNITSLQTTNELNLSTIKSLNTQIELLNSQISDLQNEINNNNLTNKQYTDKIEALEKSIKYYESYVANLENEGQVVATFMFDGSVYNLQIVNKGNFAVVTPPQSTEYKIFNYWTVDGVQQDPSSYALNENTTFVADITYKYAVLFKNESATVDSQVVEKGQYPTTPSSTPQKDGYFFEGWTLNGVDVVDPTEIEITHDTTFTAKWAQLHTVKFNDGQSDTNTYSVKHGEYLKETPTQPTKDNYQFDGWTLDGNNVVNPQSVLILEDKTFTAKWTRLWTVTFNDGVGGNTTYKVRDKEYLSELPANPSKQDYEFDGWLKDDAITNPKTVQITQDTIFTAKWTRLWNVKFYSDSSDLETYQVRDGEYLTETPFHIPPKENYEFDGWLKDGQIVSPTTVQITEDTTFTAKWTRLWTVTYSIDGQQTTEKVRDGEHVKNVPTNTTKADYEFDGWLMNAEITDPSSVEITQDTEFTAKFTRLWTVTFDDGVSEEHTTYKVRDGGKLTILPQNPTKDNYDFVGWTINGEDVVEVQNHIVNADVTFIAKYKMSVSRVFGENSWETIAEVSKKIAAQNMTAQQVEQTYGWKLGDEKETTVGEETIIMLILDFNHDDLSDGSGKAGITLGMKDLLATKYAMNSTNTNDGGWDTSLMRTDTMKILLSQLPADLQKVIKAVNKKASAGNKSTNIVTSSDKLWLLSVVEIWSKEKLSSATNTYLKKSLSVCLAEGEQYAYFNSVIQVSDPWPQIEATGDQEPSLIKSSTWTTRTATPYNSSSFSHISSRGLIVNTTIGYTTSTPVGVSFCFCI